MGTATLGRVTLEVDTLVTQQIYSSIESGDASNCGCANCRNFIAQLPGLFPKEVLEFFDKCGIDVLKDADIGHAEVSPEVHCYIGEYYFICNSLPITASDTLPNGFEFSIELITPVIPDEFINIPGARSFSFNCEIPWVLDERP